MIVLVGSGWAAQSTAGQAPIVVGFATAKSGFMTVFDVPGVAAAEVARDDLNAHGGVLGRKLRFVYADSKSDPADGANAAIKVLAKGAQLLVVTCDYDLGAGAARLAEKRHVIVFSICAGSPRWNSLGPLAYSMTFGSVTEGAVVGQWARRGKLHCRSAYVLNDVTLDYTRAVTTAAVAHFKRLGGRIVGEDTFKNDDSSFASQVTRLQAAAPRPDCIFLSSYPPGGVTLLRQLRTAGIDQPVIAPDGMDGDFWIKAVPTLSDFYYTGYASLYGDDPDPDVRRVIAKVQRKIGKLQTSTFVSGYSIVQAYARAATRAKSTDTAAVNAQLTRFRKVPLLIGPVTFTTKQRLDVGAPMRIIQVRKGKFSFLTIFRPTGVALSS